MFSAQSAGFGAKVALFSVHKRSIIDLL